MSDTQQTALLAELARFDTCAISDALDSHGLPGATTGIRPLWDVPDRIAGRARTVTAGPRPQSGPAAHIAASAVDAGEPGDILVIANGGRLDVSCWGGILTVAAGEHGIGAVVVDGACRDITESAELGFPVFGRAVVPVSARGRIVQLAAGEPVDVAGVTVRQGDYVLADRNGVVFVPADRIAEVLAMAARIAEREQEMAAAVRAGEPVAQVMHDTAFPAAASATDAAASEAGAVR
jgi:regulator of RNase E activity RraA